MTLKHFLTRTAVAAAVVAIAGAAGAAEKQMTADIVVVGGGAAGMAAVTQAVDAGKKAILLEKNAFLGGGASMAEGLGAVQTRWQRDKNYSLAVETAYNRMMSYTHYKTNGPLLRRFLEGSAEPHVPSHADVADRMHHLARGRKVQEFRARRGIH